MSGSLVGVTQLVDSFLLFVLVLNYYFFLMHGERQQAEKG